jgi:hypothetical protein
LDTFVKIIHPTPDSAEHCLRAMTMIAFPVHQELCWMEGVELAKWFGTEEKRFRITRGR